MDDKGTLTQIYFFSVKIIFFCIHISNINGTMVRGQQMFFQGDTHVPYQLVPWFFPYSPFITGGPLISQWIIFQEALL